METTTQSPSAPDTAESSVASAAPVAAATAEPKVYELSQRTLFSAAELRRLTADYETIRRGCSVRLAVLFRTEFELKLDALETPTYRQFVSQLQQPTHVALFKIEPLRGVGVLEIAPALALNLLDRLMGGAGTSNQPPRQLTEIEVALLAQVSHLITEAWCAHWASWRELKSVAAGHENDPRYLQTSAPESPMLAATFTAQIGECTGLIRLALPFAMLEPLLQRIRAEVKPPVETPVPAAAAAKPAPWNPALDHVNIPISAKLPGPLITARQLQALKVGDVLDLPEAASKEVELRLNGVPRFQGRLGTCENQWAVEVLNALKS